MSLKKAFASVLKAMRATRMLSQKNLAEVSSRTYISKLERGQCSPTLEMITSLSAPLRVSPLTLIALTIGAESGQSIKTLVDRLESELTELANAGVLDNLDIPLATSPTRKPNASSPKTRYTASSFQQAEFCFAD
ncbi:transcriptional regulator with XRE-family HTH domain [Pseudomonas sp. JUb42]|jgi:transcriptional regulator with XRE-family HTH domain|uniref:helix-turn-helix domain-containing protein n=1 Tax=Pseudomonas sp. JUb42 TaxID=2940611 RepID=UPI002169EC25|nr:helix-turn-helix transcriptional regulator [Pseudomonas sp. JUb42]MCS3470930.1 transcriptional regulator with XRE-family HTH domain [Pseudomonas sp. JUb42]